MVWAAIDRGLAQVETHHMSWLEHQSGNVPWESWTSARAGGDLAAQVIARRARVGDPGRWLSVTIQALEEAAEGFRERSNDEYNYGVASVGRPTVVLADLHRSLYGFDVQRRYSSMDLFRELERQWRAALRSYDYALEGAFGARELEAEREAFVAIATSGERPKPRSGETPAAWIARLRAWLARLPAQGRTALAARSTALKVVDGLAHRVGVSDAGSALGAGSGAER